LNNEQGKQVGMFNRNPILHADLIKILPKMGDGEGGTTDWLNDNAINAFFDALCLAARQKLDARLTRAGTPILDNVPRFHTLNTNWSSHMIDKDGRRYDGVKNWAKRGKCGGQDLLTVQRLFIPVHLHNHWVLAIVHPAERQVWAFDSMNSGYNLNEVLGAVRAYLTGELGAHFRAEEWRFARGESGRQVNATDCGVYTCFNAFASFYGAPALLMGSRNLSDARRVMAAILLAGGFNGEFDLEAYHPTFKLPLSPAAAATNGVVNGTAVNGD
jgi:sentrin-specific protease 1